MPQIHPEVAAFEFGGIQTRNGAVEKQSVRAMKLVAKQGGKLVKVDGLLADGKDRNIRRRNADAVAKKA
jgi:hypothetical protein